MEDEEDEEGGSGDVGVDGGADPLSLPFLRPIGVSAREPSASAAGGALPALPRHSPPLPRSSHIAASSRKLIASFPPPPDAWQAKRPRPQSVDRPCLADSSMMVTSPSPPSSSSKRSLPSLLKISEHAHATYLRLRRCRFRFRRFRSSGGDVGSGSGGAA